jgi:hypothetical protein
MPNKTQEHEVQTLVLAELRGKADPEYQTRIEADRVTAEWRVKLTPTTPQEWVEDLPLFGGERQGGLF